MSGWPAHSLRTPLRCHPRAKLGLSASARSTSVIIASMSSPKYARAKAALLGYRDHRPRLRGLAGRNQHLFGDLTQDFRSDCRKLADDSTLRPRRGPDRILNLAKPPLPSGAALQEFASPM